MPASDDDVDELYRRAPAEFTAARNALAKQTGTAGTAIRALEKPTLAAWAVNQLYWRHRKTYDHLVAAATRLRAAHRQLLSGRQTDIALAEAAHREALKAAVADIRGLLGEAGDGVSPAVMRAVADTLEALPAPGPPGRLTRPLQPPGLEALAGLVPVRGRGALPRPPAVRAPAPAPPARSQPSARQADLEARREALARRRRHVMLERDCRVARVVAARATGALKQARQLLANAERERARVAERLDRAAQQVEQRRTEVSRLEFEARRAAAERDRLDAALCDDAG